MTSIITPFPAIQSGFSLSLSAQPSIPSEDSSTCEDDNTSERSHRNSIGKSSSTSWPTEGVHASENEQPLMDQKQSSIVSKICCTWTEEKENTVRKPYDYIVSLGGKAFRRHFLFALNVWLQVDMESCEVIDNVVAKLHNSSLLIDDIEDESKHRRGALSAHEVYGIAQTINAANYVYFEAQDQLRKLSNWPHAFVIFNEELLNLHRGQGMELYWRDTLQWPSEADYLQMIGNKTGGLFRLILRLLESVNKFEHEIEPVVDIIGLMFQIADDYKNLKDDKMSAEKGYCDDLTEGKFSFPISHAMWINTPQKGEILRILKSKTTDDQVKAYVVQCLDECGSFEYTKQIMQELYERAKALLDAIPQRNPAIEALVEKLMDGLKKT